MYLRHWRLTTAPFVDQLEERGYFATPTQEEAAARLQFLIEGQQRLGLLTGPSGTGKSLLLEVFTQRWRSQGAKVCRLSLLGLETSELLNAIVWAWSDGTIPAAPLAERWQQITDQLTAWRHCRTPVLLLADDVEQADPTLLTQLTRLALLDRTAGSPLTIVLAGRGAAIDRLSSRLLELVDLRIDVEPWDLADTRGFVTHALAQAGRDAPIFTDEALEQLHELTQGVPRHIVQLAELALIAGAGQQRAMIDVETLESVFHELAVVHSSGVAA